MSEEKKIQRGGVTPEQKETLNDETLEGVSGGGVSDYRYNHDPGIRAVQKSEECRMYCHHRDTDVCPHRDDLSDFINNSAEHCPAYKPY